MEEDGHDLHILIDVTNKGMKKIKKSFVCLLNSIVMFCCWPLKFTYSVVHNLSSHTLRGLCSVLGRKSWKALGGLSYVRS